jgi:hypothetical protein
VDRWDRFRDREYLHIQLYLSPRRFVRRKIIPVIASSLEPMQPSQDEIADCLERCKSLGMRMGKIVKPEHLWEERHRQSTRLLGYAGKCP